MSDVKQSYFHEKTEAVLEKRDDSFLITFQRARLRLQDQLEIELIRDADHELTKEVQMDEDELNITVHIPSSFIDFKHIHKKQEYAKWLFADQLVKKVEDHQLNRLNLLICPENIVVDSSMTPYFLHYGVTESLPPYEKEEERVFEELKAAVSAAVDGSQSFERYLKYRDTLKLSDEVKEILYAEDTHTLRELIGRHIRSLENKEKELVKEPKKKWKIRKYMLIGSIVLLVPILVFTVYSIFFIQPKQEAYIETSEFFLNSNYSEVVETLDGYDAEGMPYVTQFQLATSYIVNESLTAEQKKNIQNTITLQSDNRYFLYWIHVGRGMNEKAVDLARSLEDRDLIMFALLNLREDVKDNDSLSGEEKQQKLDSIQTELDEYVKEQEQQQQEEQNQQSDQNSSNSEEQQNNKE
ncbi:type VII secretion protein EssB [Halobacillus ihumii]|uniref:type VII secretion protein EssB n=1 Tax=Halobacillus ihumii TaxID=2686092 RepID=UPI0013D4812A|nr:type VII secretion protein EssB [Halobacillus ihumii]